MPEYHGILVDAAFENGWISANFEVLGSRKSADNPWILCRIKVAQEDVKKAAELIQDNMKEGYYAHLYRGGDLTVIFKRKVFCVTPDRATWEPVVDYGLSIGIPREQLSIKPARFEEETY